MVGVGISITIVDQKGIVVDAVEKVDHLVHRKLAVTVVVEQAVESLQLVDVELLHAAQGPLGRKLRARPCDRRR